MPYPNEHSARLRDPGDFKKDKWGRKKDGVIFGRVKVPSSVSVIWGQLKSQSGKEAAPAALRFPTSSWTAEKAKAWLKKNNVKYIRFEPAREQEETVKLFAADELTLVSSKLQFEQPENGDPDRLSITLTARTDAVVETHFGRMIHDLHGVFYKEKIPIDYRHNPDEIAGFNNKVDVSDEAVCCSGQLVSTREGDIASRLISQMKAGIPYEASIFFGGQGLEIEEVPSGKSASVNGKDFNGPGLVFRKWPLRGVAICPYGADNKTGVKFSDEMVPALFHSYKEEDMSTDVENAELEAQEDSKVENQEDSENTSTTELQQSHEDEITGKDFIDAFGVDGAVWYAEGKSFSEAGALYIKKLEARVKDLEGRLKSIDRGASEALESSDDNDDDVDPEFQKKVTELSNRIGPRLAEFAAKIKLPRR